MNYDKFVILQEKIYNVYGNSIYDHMTNECSLLLHSAYGNQYLSAGLQLEYGCKTVYYRMISEKPMKLELVADDTEIKKIIDRAMPVTFYYG